MSTSPKSNPKEIAAYLDGDLSGEDRTAFENRLNTDRGLARATQLRRAIDEAISQQSSIDFQRTVSQVSQEFHAASRKSGARIFRLGGHKLLRIAAAVLLLVAALTITWRAIDSTPVSGGELYATYYRPYELSEAVRGGNNLIAIEEAAPPYQSGVELYQAGEYEEAASVFALMSKEDPEDMRVTYALAQSYLNQTPAKVDAATVELDKIISEGNSIYVVNAQWYRALLHVKAGEKANALPLLGAVIDAGGQLGETAQDLYKEID